MVTPRVPFVRQALLWGRLHEQDRDLAPSMEERYMPQVMSLCCPKQGALDTVLILSSAPGLSQGEKQKVKERRGGFPHALAARRQGTLQCCRSLGLREQSAVITEKVGR